MGGLAFALGVGAAVLTGTPVASAETSDSTPGPSTTSSSTGESAGGESRSTTKSPETTADDHVTAESTTGVDSEGSDEAASDDVSVAAAPDTGDTDTDSGDDAAAAPEKDTRMEPAVQPHRKARVAVADSPTAAAAEPSDSLFDNVSPTLNHDPAEDIAVGATVVGNLHPVDPDSTKLTYTATRPSHGSVRINADGTFAYTPNTTYTGQDRFTVTVSDARSGFHLHGIEGLLSLFTFGLLGNSGHRASQTVFIGYQHVVVASGLNRPVDFRFLPDGRIVVAEKGGTIKVVDNTTGTAQTLVTLPVLTQGERGINGITVDPAFASNGALYVAYTTTAAHDRLSQLTMTANAINAATEKVLLESSEAAAFYHRGGALAFGPDGKLYWGLGDNREPGNAQNLNNFHGKILRINPDGTTPSDNPVLAAGALPQIYAYGLRNPFRLTFTPSGQLLVADVGEASFEELNLVTAGGNYGWPGSEGNCKRNCAGTKNPIFAYAHGSGAAITSVFVYNGSKLGPRYQNKVFIADTVQGWIKVLTCSVDFTSCGAVQTFDSEGGSTVGLSQGPDGNLYQLVYEPGSLVRIGLPSGAPSAV
ncbi:PQQ-dependent sugar dehydrogenase [Mycolicibacterium psychrotolerans]|nr:PQQ-dependent sugar dehydrogenase [Mycolicibacterium psychrotolerans]